MNPLVLLPLLAAAAVAAPGLVGLNAGLPIQTYQTVQQVQVPLQQTVHYESRPVVTGYSSTILKPSIVQQTVAQPILAAQPVISGLTFRQLEPPSFPPLEPPMGLPNNSADYPAPTLPPLQPPGNGSADSPFPGLPAPPSPSQITPVLYQLNNPVSQFVAPVVQARVAQPVVQAVAAPAQIAVAQPVVRVAQPVVQVAAVRAAQAADYEPLVTKEQVLAPVRQNTIVTPQVTQVQPEVSVRKVPIDVPVAQPVYQTPVIHQTVVAQPQVVTSQVVAQPQLLRQVVGQQVLGQQVFGQQVYGQQVLGQQLVGQQVVGGVSGVRVISA